MRTPHVAFERIRPVLTRAVLLVALVAGLIALARSDTLHRELLDVLEAAKDVIAAHPVLGPIAFVLLSALSSLLAFVSSTVLVPAAVYAWGAPVTILLLWLGWCLGGTTAYLLALKFGRPVLRWVVSSHALSRYSHLLEKQPHFSSVMLFQLTMPSEIAGYLLGLARCPLPRYLSTLMMAEVPFAVGTVLLAVGFVQRNTMTLLSVCVVGALALVVLARVVRAAHATP